MFALVFQLLAFLHLIYIFQYKFIKVEIMTKSFKTPFLHYTIPNFLKQQEYNLLTKVYDNLQFLQKQSDLFHFFQTKQLNANPDLEFFKKQLNRQMGKLVDLKNSNYSIFASYYFKGDYLLCHDDVIQDRKFAFSYYLEDHPSGALVLYDNKAMKPQKTIKVTKNLLVIFQVSNISFHEVDFCKQDGRKAVTGWLNIKGMSKNRQEKKSSVFKQNIPKNIAYFPLQEDFDSEQYYCFPQMQYLFEAKKQYISGPFYQRKINKLQLDTTVAFKLKGYELFSADIFQFKTGNYILLNDSINTINEDILDVFLMQIPKNAKNSQESAIKIVQENGDVSAIPYSNNTAFMIRRNKKHYFVERVQKEFFLCHLMYKRIEKEKKGKKVQMKENIKYQKDINVKSIRQSLVNYLDEKRQFLTQKAEPKKLKGKSNKKEEKITDKTRESKSKQKRQVISEKPQKQLITKKSKKISKLKKKNNRKSALNKKP